MKINVSPPPGNPPFPQAGASANDDAAGALEQIRTKIATGELSANAPCDGMHNEWTEESKGKFNAALGKMFGWKLYSYSILKTSLRRGSFRVVIGREAK